MHHDESMHAKFAWDTFQGQLYKYNPLLHGPFQFFAVATSFLLLGVDGMDGQGRAGDFGVALVGLTIIWRRWLGTAGMVLAVAMLVFSPSFTYFSRMLREDSYTVTWTMLAATGLVGYVLRAGERLVLRLLRRARLRLRDQGIDLHHGLHLRHLHDPLGAPRELREAVAAHPHRGGRRGAGRRLLSAVMGTTRRSCSRSGGPVPGPGGRGPALGFAYARLRPRRRSAVAPGRTGRQGTFTRALRTLVPTATASGASARSGAG